MSMKGIDVSYANGVIDWAKIKAAGISFAIIRAGYGRYQVDSQFSANIKGALAQGIPVGIYWFSYALDAASARQEAKKCMETIKGYEIKLPVFYDFEYDTIRYAKEQGVTLGKTEYNQFARAFLEEIRAGGYTPGIYYNLDYYRTMVDSSVLAGYTVWYAQYASSPNHSGYDIWQYSGSGTIAGLSGKFDMNELKNTALLEPESEKAGWQKDETGWWYRYADGTKPKKQWVKIDGKSYYFDERGYWVEYPQETRYHTLGDVTSELYRQTLNKLIEKKILNGREGTGEDLVLDLGEDTIRTLVMLDRTGLFG